MRRASTFRCRSVPGPELVFRIVIDGGQLGAQEESWASDYLRRLRAPWQATLTGYRRKVPDALLKTTDPVVLLDERGSQMSSPQLSQWILHLGLNTVFVIGGSHGFVSPWVSRHRLSLGPLTLPHRLAAVVFAEQLYRAYTLSIGHPYHHDG